MMPLLPIRPLLTTPVFFFNRLSRHYLSPVAASGKKDESELRTSRTAAADDAQAPIDLVSETFESDGSASDSDNSSDAAVVEPVDQAAAEIPGAANLLAASDFAQHLLNDMHAPMITLILEEQALAPLACWHAYLLGLVQQGCEARLAALSEAVAANMPLQTCTGNDIFRFAWRARQNSTTVVLRLSTHGLHVPATANYVLLVQPARGHEASHPVVSCLPCGCALSAALYSCSVDV